MKYIKNIVTALALTLSCAVMAQDAGRPDGLPQTATSTTPAAKPSGSAHPYVAPAGREAATHKKTAARPAHNGPTEAKQPTGAEAARHKTPATRPVHAGPTPAIVTASQAEHYRQKANASK